MASYLKLLTPPPPHLFIFAGQVEVVFYISLHPTQEVGVDGVAQHTRTLVGRLHLKRAESGPPLYRVLL